ncbi:hypothetical protein IJ750_00415 [bacterium]|nr:hypothetical protein [bacterium]
MYPISFYGGGETAGSAADRIYSSAKMETTGGVGKRPKSNGSVTVDKAPECDTVCFKGKESKKEGMSLFSAALMTAGAAALVIGGLGCAHKYNWIGRLGDGKFKEFLKKNEPAAKTCYDWCVKTKGFAKDGIDKIKNLFKKK